MIKKNIANIITITRIIGTFVMIYFDVLTPEWLVAYVYSGLSDIVDGYIARKLKIQSTLGSKLDSVSDLFFYTTMMIKLWPYLVEYLPTFVWVIIWTTVAIRLAVYLYVNLKMHTILSSHNILNKLTGCFMFLIPFIIKTKYFVLYAICVSSFALIAALNEIRLLIKR